MNYNRKTTSRSKVTKIAEIIADHQRQANQAAGDCAFSIIGAGQNVVDAQGTGQSFFGMARDAGIDANQQPNLKAIEGQVRGQLDQPRRREHQQSDGRAAPAARSHRRPPQPRRTSDPERPRTAAPGHPTPGPGPASQWQTHRAAYPQRPPHRRRRRPVTSGLTRRRSSRSARRICTAEERAGTRRLRATGDGQHAVDADGGDGSASGVPYGSANHGAARLEPRGADGRPRDGGAPGLPGGPVQALQCRQLPPTAPTFPTAAAGTPVTVGDTPTPARRHRPRPPAQSPVAYTSEPASPMMTGAAPVAAVPPAPAGPLPAYGADLRPPTVAAPPSRAGHCLRRRRPRQHR